MMFEAFRDFLQTIGKDETARDAVGADDLRVATAALLFHIIGADGIVTDDERAKMRALLAQEFGLDPAEADRIAEAGREADAGAVDLYQFTSVLKARMEAEHRVRFVEMLWEVTYADGEVHELEDNLIWRISDLLGVSTRDRMLMKREAADRSGFSD